MKNNPHLENARHYEKKYSETTPFVLSASLHNPELSWYLMSMFQKHWIELNSFIDSNLGRCKECSKVFYEHSLCAKKDYKEPCTQKTEDFPIFCLPESPVSPPKDMNTINEWRRYLDELELVLKEEDE